MDLSLFNRVLAELGSQLGLDGLAADEFGAATLRIGEDTDFNLMVSDDGETVTAFVELGELGEGADDPDLLRTLLEANYFWTGTGGATLGVQPDTGVVVLAQQLPLPGLTAATIEKTLQRFVEFAERGVPGEGGENEEPAAAAEMDSMRV